MKSQYFFSVTLTSDKAAINSNENKRDIQTHFLIWIIFACPTWMIYFAFFGNILEIPMLFVQCFILWKIFGFQKFYVYMAWMQPGHTSFEKVFRNYRWPHSHTYTGWSRLTCVWKICLEKRMHCIISVSDRHACK